MDNISLRTLRFLEEIAKDGMVSQRELSKRLGYALGLTNFCIRQFIRKGYISVTRVERNRLRYLLTPKGIAKRGMLTIEYLRHSYSLLNHLREILRRHFKRLFDMGCNKIILYGSYEIAELSYLAMREMGIEMVGVIDEGKVGERFLGHEIVSASSIDGIEYDRIVITLTGSRDKIKERLISRGIGKEKISFIMGL